jgi:pimeloyl-ACP methyl ester carboxylesterase
LVLCAGAAELDRAERSRLARLAGELDRLAAAGRSEDAVMSYLLQVGGLGGEEVEQLASRPDWADRVAAAGTIGRELRELAAFQHVPEQLASINVPTLVVSGEQLPAASRTALRELAGALPNAVFEEIDNAGRLAPELHAEAVATTFARFAATCTAVPSR